MIFWNSINEGHRKILSIMHTNGSCIASTYHTYQHKSYLYICCTVSAQWICFSFIFQQFYGVFFTHDQIECTLAKWTQRMTVMKWSFVFLLFGCRSLFTCFKSLVNLLLLFLCCSFNGWHFEWYLSRWSTGTSNVQAQIFTHCLDVCVCVFFYLLPSHEASERRTRVTKRCILNLCKHKTHTQYFVRPLFTWFISHCTIELFRRNYFCCRFIFTVSH